MLNGNYWGPIRVRDQKALKSDWHLWRMQCGHCQKGMRATTANFNSKVSTRKPSGAFDSHTSISGSVYISTHDSLYLSNVHLFLHAFQRSMSRGFHSLALPPAP